MSDQLSLRVSDGQCIQLVPSQTPTIPMHHVLVAHVVTSQHLERVSPADAGLGMLIIGLQLWEKRESFLRILPQGTVDFDGGRGPFALFEVVDFGDGCGVALRCLGGVTTANGAKSFPFLSVGPNSTFSSSLNPHVPHARWFFSPGLPLAPQQVDADYALSDDQAFFFAVEGYLVLRNVVPQSLIDDARRFVNHTLGRGPAAWVPEEHHPGHFRLEHSNHPSIVALARATKVATALESLMGGGNVLPVHGGQLAIRFPTVGNLQEDWTEPQALSQQTGLDWHIDGQGKDSYLPFSLILKVALSDQTLENNGNITIFPRSHRNLNVLDYYHSTIDMKDVHGTGLQKPNLSLTSGCPLQVRLAAGDALLLHPYVGHRVGTNISPNIRYSIIFRVNHKLRASHHQISREMLRSAPLLEFPRCMSLLERRLGEGPSSIPLVGRVVAAPPQPLVQSNPARPVKVVAAIPATHKLPRNECRTM